MSVANSVPSRSLNKTASRGASKHLFFPFVISGRMARFTNEDYRTVMKVQRQISWFDISSEELIGESSIDHIPLDDLKKLFSPPADDPLMYNPYEIDEHQAKQLRQWVTLSFDFTLFTYYVECFQA